MYSIKCFCGTFKNLRENNEDNFCANGYYLNIEHMDEYYNAELSDENHLRFGVFDGLGGEEKGEVASYIAAKLLKINENIKRYYFVANKQICDYSLKNERCKIGSTAVVIEIFNGFFKCSNIGDSRAYLLRDNTFLQLSMDHTSLQTLMDMGTITRELAKNSSYRNTLTQCLGIPDEKFVINPYIGKREELKAGDIILLCSDGLTAGLSDKKIMNTVLNTDQEKTIDALYYKARSGGSKDNITAILLYIEASHCKKKISIDIFAAVFALVFITVIILCSFIFFIYKVK